MRAPILALALGLALAFAAPAAQAFDSSSNAPAAHFSVEEATAFSKEIERDLAAKGARLAIVFRTGRARDKLPEGISYTHGAFWAYRAISAEDGRTLRGYAVYNLYHGDGRTLPRDRSYLAQDWPLDFTRASAVDDVAIIVPSPEMQRRILAVLDSETYARLHNPSYSLIANPLSDKHQNCNAFMMDVIAAAAWETADSAQIRANLAAHYRPTPVAVGGLERWFGPLADERLKTDDQGKRIVTATYESMADFMRENALVQETYVLAKTR